MVGLLRSGSIRVSRDMIADFFVRGKISHANVLLKAVRRCRAVSQLIIAFLPRNGSPQSLNAGTEFFDRPSVERARLEFSAAMHIGWIQGI